jgi:hypothetical protein
MPRFVHAKRISVETTFAFSTQDKRHKAPMSTGRTNTQISVPVGHRVLIPVVHAAFPFFRLRGWRQPWRVHPWMATTAAGCGAPIPAGGRTQHAIQQCEHPDSQSTQTSRRKTQHEAVPVRSSRPQVAV